MSEEINNKENIEAEKSTGTNEDELRAKIEQLEAENANLHRKLLSNDLYDNAGEEAPKSEFTRRKEYWYEKLNISLKQIDIVIGIAVACLIIVFILIGLEAAGVFSIFPK